MVEEEGGREIKMEIVKNWIFKKMLLFLPVKVFANMKFKPFYFHANENMLKNKFSEFSPSPPMIQVFSFNFVEKRMNF